MRWKSLFEYMHSLNVYLHGSELLQKIIEIMKNRDLGYQDEMIGLYFEVESKRLLNNQYENKVFGWEQQANLEQATQDLPF